MQIFEEGPPGNCVGFLIRNNIVWNGVMVSKVLYYSIGYHAAICVMDKGGRTRSRTDMYCGEDHVPCEMGEVQYNQPAITGPSGALGTGPC